MTENFSQKVMFYKVVYGITENNFVEHHFLWKVFHHEAKFSLIRVYTNFRDTPCIIVYIVMLPEFQFKFRHDWLIIRKFNNFINFNNNEGARGENDTELTALEQREQDI